MDTKYFNNFVSKVIKYIKQEVDMQKVQLLLLLLLAMLYYSSWSQQNCELSGTVYQSETKSIIENAEISVEGFSQKFFTDKTGAYRIRNLPAGATFITFSHLSFEDYSFALDLEMNEKLEFDVYLLPKAESLDEVVVEGSGTSSEIFSRLPYIETRINKSAIQREAARDITDYLRSSKNINGVRKGGTQLDPVIRGFKYSQLNIQLNGGQKIEGGCPNRMDPATAHVEIEDVESMEIIKGPYALKYGPMFGGMVNLTTGIPPHTDSSYVHLKALMAYESNWDGYKQHLNVFGGYKSVFYNFSGGQKSYGNYIDGNAREVKSSFRKYNYKGQLGFVPFKNHQVSFQVEESKGRDIRFPTLPMDERQDDTRLLSLDYRGEKISSTLESVRFKIYQSDVRHEMDNKYRPFSDTVVACSVIEAVNSGLRLETGLQLAKGLLTAGVDFEHITKDGDRNKNMIKQPGLPVKEEKLWNNAQISNMGFFGEYFRHSGQWEFVAAIRVDLNNGSSDDIVINHPVQGELYRYGADSIESTFTNMSLSVGITRNLNRNLSLSLALGRGARSPDMTERYIILLPIGYDKYDYLGNPQLKPEINNQADVTLKYHSTRFGMLQLNAFYSLINSCILGEELPPTQQKPLTKDVLGVKQFVNAGNARLRGFEVSYATPDRYPFGVSLFSAYTYGTIDRVHQFVKNENGEVVGDAEIENDAMTEIPPFEATVSAYYRFWSGRLIPKFDFRMVNAQNHVSAASYEQVSEQFFVAGLSVSCRLNKYVYISTGVDNLFDAAYYEHLNRNIIGSSNNLYEPGRSYYINLLFSF